MSSSRVSGKLAFVLLMLCTAASGCVVGSGTGDETEGSQGKAEDTGTTQSSLATTPSTHGAAHAAAVGTSSPGTNDTEPQPVPLFRHGDALHPQVEEPRSK